MEEKIRLNPECIRCLINSRINSYPEDISKEEQITYMQRLLKVIADAPKSVSAPVVVRDVGKIEKEMFGKEKSYQDIKIYFNDFMLSKEPRMTQEIADAKEPLKQALQFAMMGNYIDFGAFESIDEDKLEDFLNGAKDIDVNEQEYQSLQSDLKKASQIVYITDNCGEIVTDKMLIQIMKNCNPSAEITLLVRGYDVINDATREDAVQVGLTELVPVVENGSDIAGTWIPDLSEEARTLLEQADMIIAKGQGNFETLQMSGLNIYYVFMCKCEMFAKRFDVPRFSGMLVNDKNL